MLLTPFGKKVIDLTFCALGDYFTIISNIPSHLFCYSIELVITLCSEILIPFFQHFLYSAFSEGDDLANLGQIFVLSP